MDTEASSFETNKIFGNRLTWTSVLREAWRLCTAANKKGCHGFVVGTSQGRGYVAFSGVQDLVLGWDGNCGTLEKLDPEDRSEKPVRVHSGVLALFDHYYSRLDFQRQINSLLQCGSIVITGHSIGGSIAFLIAFRLLLHLKSTAQPVSVLCIGFGSPFLGDESFSRAVLSEGWVGSFCNVVSTCDIMPWLSLDKAVVLTHQWQALITFWYTSMQSPDSLNSPNLPLTEEDKARLFYFVVAYMMRLAQAGEGSGGRSFWPFGNYLFCSDEGAICLHDVVSIAKMMLWTGSPNCIVEEHLKYGQYVERLTHRSYQSLERSFIEGCKRAAMVQREQPERHRIGETFDVEIKRWAAGKEENLRALLSTMQYVLWPDMGWQPVSLTDLITAAAVKVVYRKATLCLHPDKMQQKRANPQQKYVAEKVFDLLKEAWNKFNSEERF